MFHDAGLAWFSETLGFYPLLYPGLRAAAPRKSHISRGIARYATLKMLCAIGGFVFSLCLLPAIQSLFQRARRQRLRGAKISL